MPTSNRRLKYAIVAVAMLALFFWWWTRPLVDQRFVGTWATQGTGGKSTVWTLGDNGWVHVQTGSAFLDYRWQVESDRLIVAHPGVKPMVPGIVVAAYEKLTGRYWGYQDPVEHGFRFVDKDTIELTEESGTFTLRRSSEE